MEDGKNHRRLAGILTIMKPKFNPNEITTARILSNDATPSRMKLNAMSHNVRRVIVTGRPIKANGETFNSGAKVFKP